MLGAVSSLGQAEPEMGGILGCLCRTWTRLSLCISSNWGYSMVLFHALWASGIPLEPSQPLPCGSDSELPRA